MPSVSIHCCAVNKYTAAHCAKMVTRINEAFTNVNSVVYVHCFTVFDYLVYDTGGQTRPASHIQPVDPFN